MKKIMAAILAFSCIFSCFASTVYASTVNETSKSAEERFLSYGYINGTNVNLRSRPSTSAPSLGQLGYRDDLEILQDKIYSDGRYWCKVLMLSGVHEGDTGYVADQYVNWD